jgi:membrane-associated phospholipid phosphatase
MKAKTMSFNLQYLWTFIWTGFFSALVYLYTNWRTDQILRSFESYFFWELQIPRINGFILIYLSVIILLIIPYFYLNISEVRILGRRVGGAMIAAGFMYYIFPTPTAYLRVVEPDMWEPLFSFLYLIDRPNNSLPSLHTLISTILALSLYPKFSRLGKIALSFWILLLHLSGILIWQHHMMDSVAAWVIAILSYAVFRKIEVQDKFTLDL